MLHLLVSGVCVCVRVRARARRAHMCTLCVVVVSDFCRPKACLFFLFLLVIFSESDSFAISWERRRPSLDGQLGRLRRLLQ